MITHKYNTTIGGWSNSYKSFKIRPPPFSALTYLSIRTALADLRQKNIFNHLLFERRAFFH